MKPLFYEQFEKGFAMQGGANIESERFQREIDEKENLQFQLTFCS